MSIPIVLPDRLCDDTILSFPTARVGEYVVDARSLRFVEPIGLVQLALFMHRTASLSDSVELLVPPGNIDTYLGRMHFYDRIPRDVAVRGSLVADRPSPHALTDVLVELTQFESCWAVEDVVERAVPFLRKIGLPMPVYSALKSAITELCDNAASHGQSPCGGFVAAQSYQSKRWYLAVGDIGIGIRQHLTRNVLYAGISSDTVAISEALKPGVTGTRDHRGWGFQEVIERLEEIGAAQLTIYSGYGKAHVSVGGERSRVRKSSTSLNQHFPGTLIQIVVGSLSR